MEEKNSTIIDYVKAYIDMGFRPIPVKYMAKKPTCEGWPKLHVTHENVSEIFLQEETNIGIVLGEASGGLTDVDFDDPDAQRFTLHFLPVTDMVFGREFAPDSHWEYVVPDAGSTKSFRIPGGEGPLVEIHGNGRQTVFPGSVHFPPRHCRKSHRHCRPRARCRPRRAAPCSGSTQTG